MNKQPTEEELIATASQLRKPEGQAGIEIGNFMNEGNLVMNLHTLAAVNPQADENILEIGMGNGAFVKNILRLDDSISYTGLDYSELMVEESIKNNQEFTAQKRAQFVHGDIQKMPFEDSSFDTIFTINTFYFWDDHKTVVKELKRILKPGGKLILSVRPYHVLSSIPVTQYNFGLWKDEEIKQLLREELEESQEIKVIEPEIGKWGQKFRLETLLLEFKKSLD